MVGVVDVVAVMDVVMEVVDLVEGEDVMYVVVDIDVVEVEASVTVVDVGGVVVMGRAVVIVGTGECWIAQVGMVCRCCSVCRCCLAFTDFQNVKAAARFVAIALVRSELYTEDQ